jgi:tetratricopeptide (TPR) repeat protein
MSRFWFYPVLPNVSVREDVVAIKGLKVGVFTEVMSAEIDGEKIEDPKTFQDTAGDEFARQVTDKFEALSRAHPSFSRVHGLDELVALVNAIENMDEKPDLEWWLLKYQVKRVETEKALKVLRREERYLCMEGGVQLMAIALRFKSGDVSALKDAALKTRPKLDALRWGFVISEWLIPTSPGMLKMEDVAPLFAQAVFLQEQKRYEDAITLYGKIIELKPDWDGAYNNRGVAYDKKGGYDHAILDFNKALEINPRYAVAYCNRGNAYYHKGEHDCAILDYNRALEINPRHAVAYYNRGNAYYHKGEHDCAILDYNKALEINSRYAGAYYNRGVAYSRKGEYDRAILDYDKALEINPRDAVAYYNRGVGYYYKKVYDKAWEDVHNAQGLGCQVNPRFLDALRKASGRQR